MLDFHFHTFRKLDARYTTYLYNARSHQASRYTDGAEDELVVDNLPETESITTRKRTSRVKQIACSMKKYSNRNDHGKGSEKRFLVYFAN